MFKWAPFKVSITTPPIQRAAAKKEIPYKLMAFYYKQHCRVVSDISDINLFAMISFIYQTKTFSKVVQIFCPGPPWYSCPPCYIFIPIHNWILRFPIIYFWLVTGKKFLLCQVFVHSVAMMNCETKKLIP